MDRKLLGLLASVAVVVLGLFAYVERDKISGPGPQLADKGQAPPPASEGSAQSVAPVPKGQGAETSAPVSEVNEKHTAPSLSEAPYPTVPPQIAGSQSAVPIAEPVQAPAQENPQTASSGSASAVPMLEAPPALFNPPVIGTVRIEKDGLAVIAGQAAPQIDVTVKFNGTAIDSGKANAQGDFAIVLTKPLPPEAGALTLEVKTPSGQILSSEQSVVIMSRGNAAEAPGVAVLTPDAPVKIVQQGGQAPAKLEKLSVVNIDSVDYDERGNMVFGGRAPAGSRVQLYMDNAPLDDGVTGADGTWKIAPSMAIAVGSHLMRADELGQDGKVKSRVEMPFYREEPATIIAAKNPAAVQTLASPKPAPTTVTVSTADNTASATADVGISQVAPMPAQKKIAAATPQVAPAAASPSGAPAVAPPAPPAEFSATPPAVEVSQPQQPPQPPALTDGQPAQLVIQPGNNLWRLSRRIYGKGTLYTVIYEANRQYIRNPDLIYPGQIFLTPGLPGKSGQ